MKHRYLTIEREYGAGGTAIAEKIAELTGIPCFGHEILELASKKAGVSVEEIEQYEESVHSSLFYTLYAMQRAYSGNTEILDKEGQTFVAEQLIIEQLADSNRRAIFLGHCASHALAGREGVISVFIHCSDKQKKADRIVEEYGIAPEEAESTRRFYDRKRANYFNVNTGRTWKDPANYDILIDDADIDLDTCAVMLSGLFRE
jgi:cytidylate kinase